MSNRQERKARKERQRTGTEVFVHVKATERKLGPVRVVANPNTGRQHVSKRALTRLRRLYQSQPAEPEGGVE